MARPAICLYAPRGSTAVANTTHTRKNVSTASITTPAAGADAGAERRDAEVPGGLRGGRQHPLEEQRGERRAAELDEPVPEREHRGDPPRDEEAERHRRVEVTARDEADRRDHHGDDETVREREVDRGAGERCPAGGDEDQGERADELGNAPTDVVEFQDAPKLGTASDGVACSESLDVKCTRTRGWWPRRCASRPGRA